MINSSSFSWTNEHMSYLSTSGQIQHLTPLSRVCVDAGAGPHARAMRMCMEGKPDDQFSVTHTKV